MSRWQEIITLKAKIKKIETNYEESRKAKLGSLRTDIDTHLVKLTRRRKEKTKLIRLKIKRGHQGNQKGIL